MPAICSLPVGPKVSLLLERLQICDGLKNITETMTATPPAPITDGCALKFPISPGCDGRHLLLIVSLSFAAWAIFVVATIGLCWYLGLLYPEGPQQPLESDTKSVKASQHASKAAKPSLPKRQEATSSSTSTVQHAGTAHDQSCDQATHSKRIRFHLLLMSPTLLLPLYFETESWGISHSMTLASAFMIGEMIFATYAKNNTNSIEAKPAAPIVANKSVPISRAEDPSSTPNTDTRQRRTALTEIFCSYLLILSLTKLFSHPFEKESWGVYLAATIISASIMTGIKTRWAQLGDMIFAAYTSTIVGLDAAKRQWSAYPGSVMPARPSGECVKNTAVEAPPKCDDPNWFTNFAEKRTQWDEPHLIGAGADWLSEFREGVQRNDVYGRLSTEEYNRFWDDFSSQWNGAQGDVAFNEACTEEDSKRWDNMFSQCDVPANISDGWMYVSIEK